jgi:methylmalonyl-CoA mutase N-terminal domain/subunit
VIAYESDAARTVDPFAGSYAVESLTDELEARILDLMGQVGDMGGAVAAIERGFQKQQIENTAFETAMQIDNKQRTIVGVNAFTTDDDEPYAPLKVDPAIEAEQCERLAALRSRRDSAAVSGALGQLQDAAQGSSAQHNCVPHIRQALSLGATGGEVADALRQVWGTYAPGRNA